VSFMHDLLFGKPKCMKEEAARQDWREAIHESRNASQASMAAARMSKRASDEALRIAQGAVEILENSYTNKRSNFR
jgi:hypothetical protein